MAQQSISMERIRLSKSAKQVFRLTDKGIVQCPDYITQSDFNNGARELQSCNLAYCHEEENGNVEVMRISEYGKRYIAFNPSLSNPVDWKWVITTTIAIIAAISAFAALFVACKALK